MGMAISRLVRMLFAKREMRILMVGLDAAGKTTILYKLKLGEIVTTIPTIGKFAYQQERVLFSTSIYSIFRLSKLSCLPFHASSSGFNVETVEYKNVSFTVWDVGGQDKVLPISNYNRLQYCLNTTLLYFCKLQSSDLTLQSIYFVRIQLFQLAAKV